MQKIIEIFPINLQPYLRLIRLHNPVGTWLLLWPCFWSIALASKNLKDSIIYFIIFGFGSLLMRSAGCIINDLIDINIDSFVERTKMRPLASRELSPKQALIFLSILLGISLILLLSLNYITIIYGFCSILLVLIYPWMKRITNWPQLFLGFTFNMGAIMGWSAVVGYTSVQSILLYIGCIFWTVYYDTIYAYQDKSDDLTIGVKSSAIALGEDKKWLKNFLKLFVIFLCSSALLSKINSIFYISLIPALLHMKWQIDKVNLNNKEDCMNKFKSNVILGWLIFGAIIIGKLS